MYRKMTATLAAAAMTLSGFAATPAQALDRGEATRLLLGLGALAVIANEVSKNRDESDRRATPRHVDVKPYKPNKRHKTNVNRSLPPQCETAVPTRKGERRYFGRPCLQKSGFRAELPNKCASTLDFGRREVVAYEKNCLLKRGYRVGRYR